MKLKLYLDITNLMQVDFLSGIQRVVREIVVRMLNDDKLDVTLMTCADEQDAFKLLDLTKFYEYFANGKGEKQDIFTGELLKISDMQAGAIFYDMDSAWHSKQKRADILPQIRNQGLKLAVYVYDIIPVIHPQYTHQNTIVKFVEYIGAYLKNADIIIASTQATLNYINKLIEQLNLKPIPGFVSWLGVDFEGSDNNSKESVRDDVKEAVKAGKYYLMVGTVEPRKNHKLVLDAFEHELFDLGYNLVFAGRFGWDVEELKKRVLEHPLLGKKLFFIENADNLSIDYLYRNSYMVAFPSFAEGFGLPVIEAFGRGVPVIASNYDVIYEVGKGYAEFFSPESEEEFVAIAKKYNDSPESYDTWKKKVAGYQPFSWEQAEGKVVEALMTLKPADEKVDVTDVKQMVMLSARTEDLLNTIPFIENYMTFIKEMVVCCPDKIVDEVKNSYNGRIDIKFLPDSVVLAGHPLPEDHTPRNFFLRCMIMKQEMLDDVFIMCDDDYRPLHPISLDFFVKDGRYVGYYFYDLRQWRGCQGELTSFDRGTHRTRDFYIENKYPTMQFNSHIPQIIDRRIFNEMVDSHPGMEMMGFDEWSSYFNYLMWAHPMKTMFCKYRTMNWPGGVTDWTMYCKPDGFDFENYYSYVYSQRGLFKGINPKWNDNVAQDNVKKKELLLNAYAWYDRNRAYLEKYMLEYCKKYGEMPVFSITNALDGEKVILPLYINFVKSSCNRIDVNIYGINKWISEPCDIEFNYHYVDGTGKEIPMGKTVLAKTNDRFIEIPFVSPPQAGQYTMVCDVVVNKNRLQAKTQVNVSEGDK